MNFITAVYSFFSVESTAELRRLFEEAALKWNVCGLAIVAPEGFNGTFSCKTEADLLGFQKTLETFGSDKELEFKNSTSEKSPFRDFNVKVRPEIVSLGAPELRPPGKVNFHLKPSEWNRVLKEEKDFVLIDTRNDYEFQLGTFTGAVNPETKKFSEFPAFLEQQKISPDKKILMFCTGGIRCEKGILELQRKGYKNVYQLEGGILKYLAEHPHDEFKGECLVFDERVAVDQELKPTATYTWCPHCGEPADVPVTCRHCETSARVCKNCQTHALRHDTCSKNCRNILERKHSLTQRRTPVHIQKSRL